MMVEDTKHLNAVTVFLLFQWRRESRRKEGRFHYQPTCRLMPHGFTQPTVVMAATCHVICVSPWMNGDLRDTCPPPGSVHRGRSGSASAQRAAGDTPTATCFTVCVPACVCVFMRMFLLSSKKTSEAGFLRTVVVTTGTTTTATTTSVAEALDQLLYSTSPRSEESHQWCGHTANLWRAGKVSGQ